MTAKEIASAVGREYRSVQNWIVAESVKNAEMSAKIAQARATSKPAQYTLAETCAIIEQGMGKDVATVFRTNAANAVLNAEQPKQQYSAAYIREVRITAGIEAAKALIAANGDLYMGRAALQIEAPKNLPDHIAKQVYAVAMKAIEKDNDKKKARGMKSLFDGMEG